MLRVLRILPFLVTKSFSLRDFLALRASCTLTRSLTHREAWREARIGEVTAQQLRAWTGTRVQPALHIDDRRCGYDMQRFQQRFDALFEPEPLIISRHWIVHVTPVPPRGHRSELVKVVAQKQNLPAGCEVLTIDGSAAGRYATFVVPIPEQFCGDLITWHVRLEYTSDLRSLRSWRHRQPVRDDGGDNGDTGSMFDYGVGDQCMSRQEVEMRRRVRLFILELADGSPFTPHWQKQLQATADKFVVEKCTEEYQEPQKEQKEQKEEECG